jgi:hypothetical protein
MAAAAALVGKVLRLVQEAVAQGFPARAVRPPPLVQIMVPQAVPQTLIRPIARQFKAAGQAAVVVAMLFSGEARPLVQAAQAAEAAKTPGLFTIMEAQAARLVTLQAAQAAQPTATAPQSKAVTASHPSARHPVPQEVAVAHLMVPTP